MKRWLIAPMFLLLGSCASAATDHKADAVVLHGQRYSAELATDEPGRERGLMMRTTLAADHSMLFVFPVSSPQGFWMKNTLIPLDILYFDTHRRLVSMQLNVPPCKADPCPVYPSNTPARYVLELSAGTARRTGVEVGDELKIDGDIGPVR
jgi:uncharacterized protein